MHGGRSDSEKNMCQQGMIYPRGMIYPQGMTSAAADRNHAPGLAVFDWKRDVCPDDIKMQRQLL